MAMMQSRQFEADGTYTNHCVLRIKYVIKHHHPEPSIVRVFSEPFPFLGFPRLCAPHLIMKILGNIYIVRVDPLLGNESINTFPWRWILGNNPSLCDKQAFPWIRD